MMKRLQPALDGVASASMIIASAVLVWVTLTSRPPEVSPTVVGRNSIAENVESLGLELTIRQSAAVGYSPGRLVLAEFADFECPFCGRHARETSSALRREFVDTGKIEYVFLNFPLESIHPSAFKASEAVECARDQGKLWDMYHLLFENQAALRASDLQQYAETISLDRTLFSTCLDGIVADRVRHDVAEGERVGVSSTPTFLVGRLESEDTLRCCE